MLCTLLDYWAEKYDVLSASQYSFRKGRATRNCLALLTTDVQTSFERKQQTVAAFIDISGAYDNVLIDILCDILQVVRFLFRLLWRKVLVFFAGGRERMKLVGYKGLPQGTILISWGAHPSCLILLYRGLIGSVLEYGSVCFTNIEDCIGYDGIYTE
jgi:hypothetical protein